VELALRLCCGASYATAKYSTFEFGKFRQTPTADNLVSGIRWAGAANFSAIELEALTKDHFERVFTARNVEIMRMAAEDEDIKIAQVLFTFLLNTFPSENSWHETKKLFSHCSQVAEGLGAGIVEITSSPFPNTELGWHGSYPAGPPSNVIFHPRVEWKSTWKKYAAWVSELCDVVADRGLRLAIEPRPREIISDTDAMLMLLESVNKPNLGVLFDTGHHFAIKEILPVSIWKLGNHIISTHLTDNDGIIEHHWAPGEGKIQWQSVLAALKHQNYHGYLTIEASGTGVEEIDFAKAKTLIERIIHRLKWEIGT